MEQPQSTTAVEGDILGETALERAVAWNPAAPNSIFRLTLEGETTASKNSDWLRPLLRKLEAYEKKLLENDPTGLTSIGEQLPRFGYSSFAKDLINQDDYVDGVLGYAVVTKRTEMVKALIDIGVALDKRWLRRWKRIYEEQFPVLLASFVGNSELIKLLVKHGASVDVSDYEGRSPLHYATMLGHVDAAHTLCLHKQLLKSKDEMGKSPIHVVWSKLIRAYQEKRWKSRDQTTLTTTDVDKALVLAEMLARSGGDVNIPDHLGNTPLHDAVRTGRIDAVEKLIELGADINVRSNKESDYWERWYRRASHEELPGLGTFPVRAERPL
jgi:hypothetical protein